MNFTVTTSILRHLKANSLAIENSEKCKEIWRWKFWIIIIMPNYMYMLLEKLIICNKNILLPGISNKQPELENFSTVTIIILTLTHD